MTPTLDSIKQQIASGNLAPVYVLHGEEGWFVDTLVKAFENVLPEEEKAFNQYVLYATQVKPGEVMDVCSRVPMMAPRQVVILKECQGARADQLDRLARYVSNPTPSTVLVICFRGEKAKGRQLMAAAKANAVVYESPRITESNITTFIESYLLTRSLSADRKSVEMLRDFVGLDLSRVYNEIDKLASILPKGSKVTPEIIEENIGVSKDYNTFELVDAIAAKDAKKIWAIADYFQANPKSNPLALVAGTLFGFFSDLLVLFFLRDKSDKSMMDALKLKSAFPLRRFKLAMSRYNAWQVIEIITALRSFDAMSKGVGSRQNEHQLFHDLIFHILTAPGNIAVE